MICNQGDIINLDFEPSTGHEPAKFRPAVVVSASDFNKRSSLTAVCPITSVDNGYPMHVYVEDEGADVRGYACVEQLRTMDLEMRRCELLGCASSKDMGEILTCIGAMFGI